mmetsp:Transcript_45488/g.109512  ORF Transcript_45488/g.109512 Transcript_45488/m.109512 type:complete len:146 (-) Transcript_45488:20-457(-)
MAEDECEVGRGQEEEWDGRPLLLGLPGWKCSIYNQLIDKLVEGPMPGAKKRPQLPHPSRQKGGNNSVMPGSNVSSVLDSPVMAAVTTHTHTLGGVGSPTDSSPPSVLPRVQGASKRETRHLESPFNRSPLPGSPGDRSIAEWRDI